MQREYLLEKIDKAFAVHDVVALLGSRQVGKTTIAKQYIAKLPYKLPRQNYFDLEDYDDLIRLNNPQLTLSQLNGLVVIDEIQLRPDLFSSLRVLVDNRRGDLRFLILGSASGILLSQSSQSLAGRIEYIEVNPFSSNETSEFDLLWLRGGFPKSFLAKNDEYSGAWREAYIKTFLEQDIPNLGIKISPLNLRRFWLLLANYHGNICNFSEIGRLISLSDKTVRHYLDILVGTFMIRQLPAWAENISKQQVKRPKIYFRDSGILHSLININSKQDLLLSSKIGASWEGFVIEELIRLHKSHECYFWSTQSRAELDLLIVKGAEKYGFEVKYTDKPKITKSMLIALEDLKLEKLTVIYPGKSSFELMDKIFVTNLHDLLKSTLKK